MTVPGDWLDSALQTRQSTDADYVGCHVEVTPPETPHHPARDDHHTGFPQFRGGAPGLKS
jgi:hypothetical protein